MSAMVLVDGGSNPLRGQAAIPPYQLFELPVKRINKFYSVRLFEKYFSKTTLQC